MKELSKEFLSRIVPKPIFLHNQSLLMLEKTNLKTLKQPMCENYLNNKILNIFDYF
jgi:hypothetical protein